MTVCQKCTAVFGCVQFYCYIYSRENGLEEFSLWVSLGGQIHGKISKDISNIIEFISNGIEFISNVREFKPQIFKGGLRIVFAV